uniref:Methyltransferase small domain-containing protein n=1 Tax=Chrysotila carterae TaxID=13221 RepID=A0A7S4BPI9_CHRCT
MAALGVKRYETGLLELHKQLSPPSMVAHPHSTLASRSSGTRITWSTLPPQLHPAGAGVPAERRQRKCDQIDSVLAIVMPLASKEDMHIVDFGGGTGAIALPLAGLLPEVTVTIVDVSEKSLAIAQRCAIRAVRSPQLFLFQVRSMLLLRTQHCGFSIWAGSSPA